MTATMTCTDVQLDRKLLVAALNRVGGAIPPRTNKAILECVHLHASGGVLRLSTTDTDIAMTTTVACDGELPACVVRFRDLLHRIKSSKAASCSLSFDEERDALVVNGGRVEHVVHTLDIDEYPPVASEPIGQMLAIPTESLRSALKTCIGVASRENTRYAINGVLLERNINGTRLVATDGRRLATVELDGGEGDFTGSVILPRQLVNLIGKAVDPKHDDVICIWVNEQPIEDGKKKQPADIHACGTNWTVSCPAVEGNFPTYRDVIPRPGSRFIVDRGDFAGVLTEVSTAVDSLNKRVLLWFSAASLRVSTSSPGNGDSSGAVEAVFDGGGDEAIVIGINPTFLLDAVKSITSDEIVFDLRQNVLDQRDNSVRSSPLCIRRRDSESVRFVLMPVNMTLPPSLETLGSNCAALAV